MNATEYLKAAKIRKKEARENRKDTIITWLSLAMITFACYLVGQFIWKG